MNATRTITAPRRFLNMPVRVGSPVRHLRLRVAGKCVVGFDVALTDSAPDFHTYFDLTSAAPLRAGDDVALSLDASAGALSDDDAALLAAITNDDDIRAPNLYAEPLRPQVHFTAARGWLNDPNGLVHVDNRWHLFFQHNPFGLSWGSMTWGHAVSDDLLHWRELPAALHPDELGKMFSGSAVVDHDNTAGLQQGSSPPVIAIYTAAGGRTPESQGRPYTQCLAFSNDSGATFTKYQNNPVLDHIAFSNRDPKVVRHAESGQWIMALYLGAEKGDTKLAFALFGSPDLKTWRERSRITFTGTGECPDFFPLALDDKPDRPRWIFWAADGAYYVGSFDGQTFTPETQQLRAYARPDKSRSENNTPYAAQRFDNAPHDRCVQIAWLRGHMPGMPFTQQMALPVELSLRTTMNGPRIFISPASEIEQLHADSFALGDIEITASPIALEHAREIESCCARLRFMLNDRDAKQLTIHAFGTPIVFDFEDQMFTCEGAVAHFDDAAFPAAVDLITDRCSVELFVGSGMHYLAVGIVHPHPDAGITLATSRGSALARDVKLFSLRSIWGSR